MFVLDHMIRSGQCQSTLIWLCYEMDWNTICLPLEEESPHCYLLFTLHILKPHYLTFSLRQLLLLLFILFFLKLIHGLTEFWFGLIVLCGHGLFPLTRWPICLAVLHLFWLNALHFHSTKSSNPSWNTKTTAIIPAILVILHHIIPYRK